MLIGVDSGLTIYSHNQLYGRWDLRRATTAPKPTNRSLRMLIRTRNHAARLYSASDISGDIAGRPEPRLRVVSRQ